MQALKRRLRTTGGRWFSVLNREYREVRKTVFGFLRARKLFVFPSILQSLEQLEQWKKDAEDFSAGAELRTVLGKGFAGLDTDWVALTPPLSGRWR